MVKSQILNPISGLALVASTLILTATLTSASLAEDTPVAKVAGITLTQADLEEFLSEQLEQIELQKAKLFEDGLGPLVEKTLLERAANDKGVPLTAYLEAEIADRTEPVTDADVDSWYSANKARVGGKTKESIAPQIKNFLVQNQNVQARSAVVAELRKKYPVEIFLEPVRISFSEEGATTKGTADAPVTIVEFSDFQCPACKGFNPTLTEVLDRYGDDVRVVFRQFPLRSIHPKAQKAAEAALCARDQEKFWQLHDAMFANQRKIDVDGLKETAKGLGLDSETFDQCLDSGQHASRVQADLDIGSKIGLNGTPSVFINGRVIAPGRVPSVGQMASVIDEELLRHASKKEKK